MRQPRRRPEHVPRPRENRSGICSTRPRWSSGRRETLAGPVGAHAKSVRQQVASLSGGQRQTVAIAKAVLWNTKLVILDEPTAALGVAQTEQVLDLVRRLADNGLGGLLISHNMNDVFAGRRPHRRPVPRPDGGQVPASDVTTSQVVELITTGRRRRTSRLHRPTREAVSMTTSIDDRRRRERRRSRTSGPARQSLGESSGRLHRPAARRRHRLAARRPRPDRPRRSCSRSCGRETFATKRQLRQPAHPGRARPSASRWAWSSSCCWARSTCPPASRPATCRRGHGRPDEPSTAWPWWLGHPRGARSPARSSACSSACSSRGSASRRSSSRWRASSGCRASLLLRHRRGRHDPVDNDVILALMNNNLPPWLGWVLSVRRDRGLRGASR